MGVKVDSSAASEEQKTNTKTNSDIKHRPTDQSGVSESLFKKKTFFMETHLLMKTDNKKRDLLQKIFIGPESLSEIWSIPQKIFIGPESLSEMWSILGVGKSLQLFRDLEQIMFPRFGKIEFPNFEKLEQKLFPKSVGELFPYLFFIICP